MIPSELTPTTTCVLPSSTEIFNIFSSYLQTLSFDQLVVSDSRDGYCFGWQDHHSNGEPVVKIDYATTAKEQQYHPPPSRLQPSAPRPPFSTFDRNLVPTQPNLRNPKRLGTLSVAPSSNLKSKNQPLDSVSTSTFVDPHQKPHPANSSVRTHKRSFTDTDLENKDPCASQPTKKPATKPRKTQNRRAPGSILHTSERSELLNQHGSRRTKARTYFILCPEDDCTKSFTRIYDCERHVRTIHAEKSRVRCSFCGVSFSRLDALERHIKARKHRVA